jgi:hypothetical protein
VTEPANSIGKLGFRRWYERQLLESHAWLITAVLCGLGIAVSVEALSFKRPGFVLTLAFVFIAGLVCWHALQRYRAIMDLAERLGERSTCAACTTYGRFHLVSDVPKITVRCRKCSNEWSLES